MSRDEEFEAVRPLEATHTAWESPRTPRPRQPPHPGPWFTPPAQTPDAGPETPDARAETPDYVSTAAVLLLERLSSLERAVLVLREMLGCDMAGIAAAVGQPEVTCRELAATITARTDTGTRPWPREITGADRVARLLTAIVPALLSVGITMRPTDPADGPGALFHDPHGTLLGALALDIADNRVHTVHWLPAQQVRKETGEPT
ncbi:hypothetical protein OG866_44735 (plasmid) [Streptomyces sp. NBC_00663]|uniref:hypothetical protein n=1 Tax=Streptomyces sp. NBC_00663 TaxID=2975801 RepID=UPI002E342FFD|nr:hypothetical protein [Streptomyces sp. NBC_00663]